MKTAVDTARTSSWALVFSDFKEITKARLAISVVFSSIAGYLLGAEQSDLGPFIVAGFWGLLYGRGLKCL